MAFNKIYLFAIMTCAFLMTMTMDICAAEDPASNFVDSPSPGAGTITPQAAAPAPEASQPAPPVSGPGSGSPPVAANPGVISAPGVTGTVTQHKGEDGSILTISRFNGNIPANAFPSFPTMWGNPFMQPYPFAGPGYPYPQQQGQFRNGR